MTDSTYVVSLALRFWLILPMLSLMHLYSDWVYLCFLSGADILTDFTYTISHLLAEQSVWMGRMSHLLIFWPFLHIPSLIYRYSDWFYLCCLSRIYILTDSTYTNSHLLTFWLVLPMLPRSHLYSDWFYLCYLSCAYILPDSTYVVSHVLMF